MPPVFLRCHQEVDADEVVLQVKEEATFKMTDTTGSAHVGLGVHDTAG